MRALRMLLYYFYTPLDARIGVERAPGALLLSPVGDRTLAAKYPAPTQITSSVALFYGAP